MTTHPLTLRLWQIAAKHGEECPRCKGEGYTSSPHIVGSAWSHTMTACTCPAGQQFKAAVAAQQGEVRNGENYH